LRRNPEKDLEEYKFTLHGLQCADLIRNNYKKQSKLTEDEEKHSKSI
jgi:hypothetical protein